MWAAAIYDFKYNSTYLSRDYVGQKPLFFSHNKNNLIFSSQINGIFEVKNDFKFSEKNALEYFKFNHFPAPLTGYEKLFQVSPGEIISFKKNKISKKNYWNLEKGGDYNKFFEKNYLNSIRDLFSKIIKNFSIADEKVGLCLSSGIDSQIIKINLIRSLKKIKTFTIGFKETTYDESRFIKSSPVNKNYKKILSKKDYQLIFNKLKNEIFFPFGDSSIIPTYKVFNLVKKKTNVTLTGDGGDELFFGYLAFKGFYILRIVKNFLPLFVLKFFKLLFGNLKSSDKYLDNKKKLSFFFKHIEKRDYNILRLWISNFDNKEQKAYFGKNFLGLRINSNKIQKLYKQYSDKMKFSQIYFFRYYLHVILLKADFSSMLNSVESRAPYLSKDLVNFSLDLASKKNFNLFSQRSLMKKIFKVDFNYINEKKKHGFAFNKSELLKNKKFIQKNIKKKLMINYKYFKKYVLYLEGDMNYEQYLWNEIILNLSRQNLEE